MPCYVIDERALVRNLEILGGVAARTGARILLAQKAFSCAAAYPLCARYLAGTTASSLFEALHGKRHFPGEVHVFSPAFLPEEMPELLRAVDHVVFNSPRQVARFAPAARAAGVSPGLRVNPGVSVAATPAYDPCRPGSRLGTSRADLNAAGGEVLSLIEGLHFHALCEQGADELEQVLNGFVERFGDLVGRMRWVNFGGGHHITRPGYDLAKLERLIRDFRARWPGPVLYLEPGEAVALDAGTLEAKVLEIQPRGPDGVANAILDVSAACHMPDVLEMPYTPRVTGAAIGPGGPCVYRFGGPTCLAGDEIGTYSFPAPLTEGATVVFEDMAIYSMVKNNTFNGVNLPDIVWQRPDGSRETLRAFGYDDFASRLG